MTTTKNACTTKFQKFIDCFKNKGAKFMYIAPYNFDFAYIDKPFVYLKFVNLDLVYIFIKMQVKISHQTLQFSKNPQQAKNRLVLKLKF